MSADKNPFMNIEQARDLLSAYLDGEVTAEEQAMVEQALTDSPDLHRELETLRRTLTMLSSLPPVAAPRPFTLREADVRPKSLASKRSAWGAPAWVVGWAGLAVALLCVLAAGGLFWNMRFGAMPAAAPAAQIALAPTPLPSAAQAESAAAPAEAAAQKTGPETVTQSATLAALPTELPAPSIMAEPVTPQMAAPAEAPKLEIAEAEDEAAQAEVPAGASADSVTAGESAPVPSALPAQDEVLVTAASTESPSAEAYIAEAAPSPPAEPPPLTLAAPMPEEAANAAGAQMKQSAESAPDQPAAAQERGEISSSPEGLTPMPLSPLTTPTPLPPAAPTLLLASTPVARLTFEPPPTPMPAVGATPTPIPVTDSAPFAWSWLIAGVIVMLMIVSGLAWWVSQKRRLS